MKLTEKAWEIFERSITDYHKKDSVDASIENPYDSSTLEHLLYRKNWIDTIQWHLEDIIRDPEINAEEALRIKRWIDDSNQNRTDTVEFIDSYFYDQYKNVKPDSDAKINTESPAWAIDRLSILALKIYHMQEEASRPNASQGHKDKVKEKLNILLEQKKDLMQGIEELLADYKSGNKKMKVYKQMKMYNDDDLNPILYNKK